MWIDSFGLAERTVTNAQWLEFMAAQGYDEPLLWLSDGWQQRRTADWTAPAFGADALIPCALVVALHLWRRNALLSIVAGTVSYMAIQQSGLFGV